MDVDGGGSIGYAEFINLSDEKMRGLDPMINAQKHKTRDVTRDMFMNLSTSNKKLIQGDNGPQLESDTQDIMSVFE